MAGNIGMISPEDLQYITHVTDEAFMVNATPIKIKRIDETNTLPSKDELFDEALPHEKQWITATINAIVTIRPTQEVLDRFGTRNSLTMAISVSYLELQRQGWTLTPDDVVEYPNAHGKVVDYYMEEIVHDGDYRDTSGNQHPVSYTLGLSDDKAPTR